MSSHRIILAALLVASATFSTACDGRLSLARDGAPVGHDGPGSTDPGSVTNPGEEEPPPGTIVRPPEDGVDEEVCQFIDPGDAPLRRLTGDEYNNTVRDLFPGIAIPTQSFSPDERISGFEANTIVGVTELMAEEYQRAAEAISPAVVAGLTDMLPVDADEATVKAFIADLGARAYRRPLEALETDELYALYVIGRDQADGAMGAQMLVEAILQSPLFLYRLESGEGAEEVVPLDDYAVASRLSYFLWGTTPDQTLLDAAAQGQLSDREDVEAAARRMLDDPRARTRINEAFAQWLRIDDLAGQDKSDAAFTDEMKESMIAETEAFIDHVIWEGDGNVDTLLTAEFSFVDANTASVYGIEVEDAGDGLVRANLPGDRRGILSHPGVLSAHGEGQMPVHRGKFIREAFFCMTPPPPPNEIVPLETFEGESMRSKAEKRMGAKDEGCAGCHSQMDGIGLAFDNYDEMGRYRTEDEFGNVLTGEGKILATGESDGDVVGPAGLAQKLAESPQVQSCVSKQFFRYAFARLNGQSDACSLAMIDKAIEDSNGDIKELFVAMTITDAFLYRRNMPSDM